MQQPTTNSDQSILSSLRQAVASMKQGQINQAEQIYQQILKSYPDHADTLHLMGLLQHRKNKNKQAVKYIKAAIEQNSNDANYYNNLGVILRSMGDTEPAIAAYQQAISIQPDQPSGYYKLGNLYLDLERYPDALEQYKQALERKPDYTAAIYDIGVTYLNLKDFEQAIHYLRKTLKAEPKLTYAYNNLAMAFSAIGDTAEEIKCYEKAAGLEPGNPDYTHTLGVIARSKGDMNLAENYFRKSLTADPNHSKSYHLLAIIKKYNDGDVKDLEHLVKTKSISDNDKSYLYFALGKIYGDRKSYDESFTYYQKGNALHRETINPDEANYTRLFNQLIKTYNSDFIKKHADLGCDSIVPIFIVGMPRSGTTLTESILSSHSQVFGAGELHYFNKLVLRIPKLLNSKEPYPACMDEITQDVSKPIINDYLSALQERSGDCSRTTDKMPSNYQSLGLISILFPNAKIINCQRHPLDNALSIFFQKFVSGNQFAFDLADIGFWYKEYERLMTHWREVLPSPIYEVHYSDMVQNPKESARSLIEFCELEWEDACLDFHKSKREIQTASAWEVRQPIYTSSLGRWKAYEAHLDPLKECLGWKE